MLVQRSVVATAAIERPASISWEDSACPLCGQAEVALILEGPDPAPADGRGLWFAVVRCEHCGLAYTNPRPSSASIKQFYPSEYPPHRRVLRNKTRTTRPVWSALFGRPCNERRGIPWHGAGRLLDFGCGAGGFLQQMARLGWKVTGLDAAPAAVNRIRDELGFTALVGSLPHSELVPGSFDVITMWHSLEHVHDPLAVLREARRLLVPGGRLIAAVPNIESLPFYAFGRSWFGLDLPRHLTHFSPKTLRMMLEAAGFHVQGVRSIRHSDWLRSSAKLATRDGRGGLASRLLRSKPLSKIAAWGCYVAGLSDCMMAVAERPG